MTSIYVGDLDSSVTETLLREFFALAGKEVSSVKICRDHITNVSRGYGYVNYPNLQDATNAIRKLNCQTLNGESVRIMLSNRDSSIRRSGHANIFIKDIDPSICGRCLHEVFVRYGNILSCKLATDSSGRPKGYGYVQYEKEEDAKKAIRKVDGMVLNDKQVHVGPFVCKEERDAAKRSKERRPTIYVKNLPKTANEGFLVGIFHCYDLIYSEFIPLDESGCSIGYGFVTFTEYAAAASAIEEKNGFSYEGRVLYVGWAQSKSERRAELKSKFEKERNNKGENLKGSNLYLKNLDDNTSEEKLKELFSEFGTIRCCKVMVDFVGRSKGYGFVAFTSSVDASKAMNEMNGKMIGRKPLYVAVAQRKEERKAMLQAHFAQVEAPPVTAPLSRHVFHPEDAEPVCFGGQGSPAGYGFQQQVFPEIGPYHYQQRSTTLQPY